MKRKSLYLLVGFALSLFMFSCTKTEFVPQGDAGNTFMKFIDGPEKKIFFAPFSDIKTVNLFDLRRDANSAAALAKSQVIVLQQDSNLVKNYNLDNHETFELLPSSLFTFVSDAAITKSGDKFSFAYKGGDFAKELKIKLDGSKWDLSKKYAIAFNIVDSAGNRIVDGLNSIVVLISLKNKYDGVYQVEGNMVDKLASRIGRYPKDEVELATTGSNAVSVTDISDPDYGGSGYWIYQTPAKAPRVAFGLGFNFDLATDAITSIWDPADAGYDMDLVSGYVSAYDPATKNITVKFTVGVNDNSSASWPPGRFTITETYTYIRPR